MRSTFGQVQDRAPTSLTTDMRPPTSISTPTKEIPYDHVATFTLLGIRGNRVQDVINTSTDGAFVAVAIGYSFIATALTVPAAQAPATTGTNPLRPSEGVANWLLTVFRDIPTLPGTLIQSAVARMCVIDFKYSIVDSATGRELQNRPIHNIAGLGDAAGERPSGRSRSQWYSCRAQRSASKSRRSRKAVDTRMPELFIVLHGYKVLGAAS